MSVLAVMFGYLLGSIPFGLLLTRAVGLGDIRAVGSGNIGATNVLRTGNKSIAAATLLLDGAKGAVAFCLVQWAVSWDVALLAGFAAMLGHVFPVWLGFRGGKGVATGLGLLLAAAWPVGVACCLIWLAAALIGRRSSVAALASFAAAPIIAMAIDWRLALFAFAVATIVYYRHDQNIARLRAGTEPRIVLRK